MKIKKFESNNYNKLNSNDEYIELTAKEDYVLYNGMDGFYHIKRSIPKGQKIFLSNYSKFNNPSSEPMNYPYIVGILPEDPNWKDNDTFGWISKKDILKYFN